MQVGQYVLIKPPEWSHPIFGKIERVGDAGPKPILVYMDKFWGYNIRNKFVSDKSKQIIDKETGHAMYGVYVNCPIDGIIQLDWYHDFYLPIVEHKRKAQVELDLKKYGKKREKSVGRDIRPPYMQEAELMAETYTMVGMQMNWATVQDKKYDERLKAVKKVHAKIAAFKPKPMTPFKKNDVVVVRNINGYKDQEHQALVAAMGPKKIQAGELIRDIMWEGIRYSVPVDAEVLSDTQALVLYTEDFPATQIYDVVQWQRTGGRNFASKSVLKL